MNEALSLEYSDKMSELLAQENHGNADILHEEADVLVCELLEKLGYSEIVSKFRKMEKWYG